MRKRGGEKDAEGGDANANDIPDNDVFVDGGGNPDVDAPEAHSRSRNRGVPQINEYSLFRNSNLTRDASNVGLEYEVVRGATSYFSQSLFLSPSLSLSLLLFFFSQISNNF